MSRLLIAASHGRRYRTVVRNVRVGFTLIELLIVIGIIGVILGILLPTLELAREHANTTACAANLNQIGLAITLYENENHGSFPRTTYQAGAPITVGTGTATDPFTTGGPSANDVTANVYLLLRAEKLPAVVFTDPYNDVVEFSADRRDPTQHCNFADYHANLAYSFANPYPDASVATTYKPGAGLPSGFAIAADLNPGDNGNSKTHERDGQNVLYADNHVEFQKTNRCGLNGDDIYTNAAGIVSGSPVSAGDSVLLPTAP